MAIAASTKRVPILENQDIQMWGNLVSPTYPWYDSILNAVQLCYINKPTIPRTFDDIIFRTQNVQFANIKDFASAVRPDNLSLIKNTGQFRGFPVRSDLLTYRLTEITTGAAPPDGGTSVTPLGMAGITLDTDDRTLANISYTDILVAYPLRIGTGEIFTVHLVFQISAIDAAALAAIGVLGGYWIFDVWVYRGDEQDIGAQINHQTTTGSLENDSMSMTPVVIPASDNFKNVYVKFQITTYTYINKKLYYDYQISAAPGSTLITPSGLFRISIVSDTTTTSLYATDVTDANPISLGRGGLTVQLIKTVSATDVTNLDGDEFSVQMNIYDGDKASHTGTALQTFQSVGGNLGANLGSPVYTFIDSEFGEGGLHGNAEGIFIELIILISPPI